MSDPIDRVKDRETAALHMASLAKKELQRRDGLTQGQDHTKAQVKQ